MGSIAKSNMRKSFLIYEEMRNYLTIYETAVSHILLCNRSIQNFLKYEENLIFFFISACTLEFRDVSFNCSHVRIFGCTNFPAPARWTKQCEKRVGWDRGTQHMFSKNKSRKSWDSKKLRKVQSSGFHSLA
jgi:hypothetical protein